MIWWTTRPQWAGGWCLWLEAEAELAALRAERDWRGVTQLPDEVRRGTARSLLGVEAVKDDEGGAVRELLPSGSARRGFAWSPTPRALEILRAHGLTLPPAPDVGALIVANARESFVDAAPLRGRVTCHSTEDVVAAMGEHAPPRPSGKPPAWILRGSLCAAGRDRIVAEAPSARVTAFVRERLPGGPVDVAPMLDIVEEYAIHGYVGSSGSIQVATAVRYPGSARPDPHPRAVTNAASDVQDALRRAFEQVAERLVGAGYFGPVGIDAFTWRDEAGTSQLHAVSDVNARYTYFFGQCAPHLVGLEYRC